MELRAPTAGSRACHWVLKVGNLKESMRFYEAVLGMVVLRHEEFDSGCEATCNGPYAGAWSKTMVGYGPEETNFALELTYNYGIDSYESGGDLLYIALHLDVAETSRRCEVAGFATVVEGDTLLITGPDGYKYRILPRIPDRAERFLGVGIRVASLAASVGYWGDLLGLEVGEPQSGLGGGGGGDIGGGCAAVGFGGEEAVRLLLIDDGSGAAVDHKLAGGRIAFACRAVPPIYEAVKAAGRTILTPPLTLPTPGKADVVVTILADPDGYEICFVEDVAFYQLAEPKYDLIDWAARAARGGDGAPPPKTARVAHDAAAGIITALTEEDVPKGTVLLDFGAGWCKNCKRLLPAVEQIARDYAGRLTVASVDIEEAEDLVDTYSVSKVPYFVLLKDGKKIGEYLGSTEDDLRALLSKEIAAQPA